MNTSNRMLSCILVLAAALCGQSMAFQPTTKSAVGFRYVRNIIRCGFGLDRIGSKWIAIMQTISINSTELN